MLWWGILVVTNPMSANVHRVLEFIDKGRKVVRGALRLGSN
jgi:hypothetical protein